MPESPSQEMRGLLTALSQEISVAHNLDEEIRRELYTHIEDKLIAYLNGDEALTEEDAFILVQEHFGNPSTIQTMYREVEVMNHYTMFARRLGAVLVASLITGIGITAMGFVFAGLTRWEGLSYNIQKVLVSIPMLAHIIFAALLLWVILLSWRKQEHRGDNPWYLRISPKQFLLILVGMVIARQAVSYLWGAHGGAQVEFHHAENGLPVLYAHGLAWMWWLSDASGRLTSGAAAFICWFLYGLSVNFLWFLPLEYSFRANLYFSFIPFYFQGIMAVPIVFLALSGIRAVWRRTVKRSILEAEG